MAKKEINEGLVKSIKGSLEGTSDVTSNGSVFEDNLPEGLTKDHVEGVHNYVTDFVAAGQLAIGEHVLDAMSKNKDIKEATGTIKMGVLGDATFSFDRDKTVTPPKGEPFVQKLASRTNVRFKSGENGPLLKSAREQLREMADKSL